MTQITSSRLSRVGRPALIKRYTQRDIIPITLDLIYGAWPKVCKREQISCTSHEPAIAGALYLEMCKLKKSRRMTGPPHIECEAASRSSTELLIPDGRIDFKLIYGFGQEDYFSIECKRVSATDRRLASAYVREGVARFTSGKYARGHEWAAMLAFVIDLDTAGSAQLINNRLRALASEIHLADVIVEESSFGTRKNLFRSGHRLPQQRRDLNILHIFIGFR